MVTTSAKRGVFEMVHRRYFTSVVFVFGTVGLAAGIESGPTAGRGNVDWPLHNLDLSNRRYADLEEINVSNVARLVVAWTFEMPPKEPIASMTPLVVDGVMYFNAGSKLYAVNAATGAPVWTYSLEPAFSGGGRGPAYGDGIVYAFGRAVIYAVDARTGKAVETFGERGALSIVSQALLFKYPGKYSRGVNPELLGYQMTTPPTYCNGTLFVGLPFSENLIRGGLVIAADARTGAIKWVFNTVPQGPEDEGWELAKDTWGYGARLGGGVWTQPAIDPELDLLYVNGSNPAVDYDGSARHGINLFTNSAIALRLSTGKLVWHFQTIHHDIWDYDTATGPLLFDVATGNTTVKGIASLGKTCYAYIWNRKTGMPLNPMVETSVPTTTDVPGEQVWPTQRASHFPPVPCQRVRHYRSLARRRGDLGFSVVQSSHGPAVRDRQERRALAQAETSWRHVVVEARTGQPAPSGRQRARSYRHYAEYERRRL